MDRAYGTPFWTYSYSRDSLGNVSAASDLLNGSDTYTYDAYSRLSADQRVVSGITATTSWADDTAHIEGWPTTITNYLGWVHRSAW